MKSIGARLLTVVEVFFYLVGAAFAIGILNCIDEFGRGNFAPLGLIPLGLCIAGIGPLLNFIFSGKASQFRK